MLQIIGVKGSPGWGENGYANPSNNTVGETDLWTDLETDLYHWTKTLRPVQVSIL